MFLPCIEKNPFARRRVLQVATLPKKKGKKDTGYWCVLLIINAMKCLTFHVQTLFLFPLGVRSGLARLGQDCTASTHRHLHFHFPPVQLLIKFENSWVVPQLSNKYAQSITVLGLIVICLPSLAFLLFWSTLAILIDPSHPKKNKKLNFMKQLKIKVSILASFHINYLR